MSYFPDQRTRFASALFSALIIFFIPLIAGLLWNIYYHRETSFNPLDGVNAFFLLIAILLSWSLLFPRSVPILLIAIVAIESFIYFWFSYVEILGGADGTAGLLVLVMMVTDPATLIITYLIRSKIRPWWFLGLINGILTWLLIYLWPFALLTIPFGGIKIALDLRRQNTQK